MSDISKYEPLWGAWRVVKLLGEGSYGKVYQISRGNDFSDKTHVGAVKIISIPQNELDYKDLRAELSSDDSVRNYYSALAQDFVIEIDTMEKLQGYTNIVGFHDHMIIPLTDRIGFDILIRMELLESLTDYASRNPLDEREVAKLGIDMCKALEVCSKFNIIHRDVKPDNIFMNSSGDFKLGDFGIARQVERTMSSMSRKGTLFYIAPEVHAGAIYSGSVDTYSLGIVMYRYLNNGRVPFLPDFPKFITPYEKDQAVIRRLNGEPIPPLKGVSPVLSNIVLKAASYDRSDRFRSPTDMRLAIEEYLSGKSPVAIPVPKASMPDKSSRYNPFLPNPRSVSADHGRYKEQTHSLEPSSSKYKGGRKVFNYDKEPISGVRGDSSVKETKNSEYKGPPPTIVIGTTTNIFITLVFLAWLAYIAVMYSYLKNWPLSILFAMVATIFPMSNVLIFKHSMNRALPALPVIIISSLGLYEMFALPLHAMYFLQYILLSVIFCLYCSKPKLIGIQWPTILLVLVSFLWISSRISGNVELDTDLFMPLVTLAGFFIGKLKWLSVKLKICCPFAYSVLFLVIRAFQSLNINLHWNIFFAFIPFFCSIFAGCLYLKSKDTPAPAYADVADSSPSA
jgi:serine/threonine protein kinase